MLDFDVGWFGAGLGIGGGSGGVDLYNDDEEES
jgi:hypothetical protein